MGRPAQILQLGPASFRVLTAGDPPLLAVTDEAVGEGSERTLGALRTVGGARSQEGVQP